MARNIYLRNNIDLFPSPFISRLIYISRKFTRKHITYIGIIVPSLKINSKSISVSSFVNKNLAEREREIDCSLDPSLFRSSSNSNLFLPSSPRNSYLAATLIFNLNHSVPTRSFETHYIALVTVHDCI